MQEKNALHYLDLAHEHFPQNLEDDPSFIYADCGYAYPILWDSFTNLELCRLDDAKRALSKMNIFPATQLPERIRIELLNYRTMTYVGLGELEAASTSLQAAATAALQIGRKRLYADAFISYQCISSRWHNSLQVRELQTFFNSHRI